MMKLKWYQSRPKQISKPRSFKLNLRQPIKNIQFPTNFIKTSKFTLYNF